jgi:NAD(P)-dependent dehydrogenase (short-subunit alcohol dehydrogenase family)
MNDMAAGDSWRLSASALGDQGVAVITGGAAGIGEAIARRLSADGYMIVIADLDGELAEAVAADISMAGRPAFGRQVDVSTAESITALFDWLADDLGRCDALVNNAGVASTATLSGLPLERWESTIAVNVTGALLATQQAVPLMKRSGRGRVVNISSISGIRASAGRIAYGTSKAAIIGLTRQLAIELAADNITVNSVCSRSGGYRDRARCSYRSNAAELLATDSDEALWPTGGGRRCCVIPQLSGRVVHHRTHHSGRRWLSCGRCP